MPLSSRSLSAALLCASVVTLLAVPDVDGADRRARLEGVRSEISRLEAELAGLRGRESGLLGELERLGAESRLRRVELQDVTLRRAQVESEVTSLGTRLADLNRAQGERRGYLAFRLREIYKAGPDQALRRLIGDDAIERYWEGVRYASYLSDRDARVLRAYREDARRLNEQRALLEGRRAALEELRVELDGRRVRLERSRRKRTRMLEEIRGDRAKRETAVHELEGAAEVLAAALPVGADGEKRRHDEVLDSNIGVEPAVSVNTAVRGAEDSHRGADEKEFPAESEFEPPGGGGLAVAFLVDVENAQSKINEVRAAAEKFHAAGVERNRLRLHRVRAAVPIQKKKRGGQRRPEGQPHSCLPATRL